MAVIDISGVCGDLDLLTTLVPGPSIDNSSGRGYYLWPEVNPGYFRAGDKTAHSGTDYLFSNEGRVTLYPVYDLGASSQEISRLHGPTLALFAPLSSGDANYTLLKNDCSNNHPSRNVTNGWNALIQAPCRYRYYRDLMTENTWTTIQVLPDGSQIISLSVQPEVNGFGPVYNPLPIKITDSFEDWSLLGTVNDLIYAGTAGAKEWARGASGDFVLKIPANANPPSGLAGSWIAGQTNLDWEEFAVSTNQGVALTVGTKYNIDNVYIQYAKGGATPTGAVVPLTGTFPRFAVLDNLPSGSFVVVRYRPTGVYALAEGVSGGATPIVRVPKKSIVCIRYEISSPEEKFSGGRNGSTSPVTLSPIISPGGFLLALAPGHPLHPTHPGPGIGYGVAAQGSKVLVWCNPSNLYPTTSPGKLRVLVISSEGIPLPGVKVNISVGPFLYVSQTTAVTNINGECFVEVNRQKNANGISLVTVSIYTKGVLIDQQSVDITLGDSLQDSDWVNNLRSGRVVISVLPGRARSGRSQRLQLGFARVQSDGIPSRFSYLPFTATCEEGRLFTDTLTQAVQSAGGGGGKTITLTPSTTDNTNWMDGPYIVEYETPSSSESDIIRCKWNGGVFPVGIIPSAYGQLYIGNNY